MPGMKQSAQEILVNNSATYWNNEVEEKTLNELSIVTLHAAFYALHQQCDQQKLSIIDYKQKAHYWKERHERAVAREKEQKEEYDKIIEELTAKIRKLNKQLFGKKSEKSKGKSETSLNAGLGDPNIDPKTGKQKKKRGQQPNNKGPDRRDYSHLPSVIGSIELATEEQRCVCCGLLYEELPGCEESEIIEITEVKAHIRKIKRKMYKKPPTCHCSGQPGIITAPPAPRLFPKTRFGVSVWRHLLLEKFHYQRPIEKALKVLNQQGLSLAPGTVTGGLKKMVPLLFPVYNAIQEHSLTASHWHADETRWEVYEPIEGKESSRWYLWIFKSQDTVIFKIAPTRSAQVPREFFKDIKSGGILSVDRYSAYKCIANEGLLVLAFCWAHVRRDFLDYAKSYPDDEDWAFDWVNDIGNVYHINSQRIEHKPNSDAFEQHDEKLREAVDNMQIKYQTQLSSELSSKKESILNSLHNHWEGLTVFVEHAFVPMDNNKAEGGLRPGVLARKAFYGSRAIWSATLLALSMSIFQTLELWGINIHYWMNEYLKACANNQGNTPEDIEQFLPWNMSTQRLKKFKTPISYEDSS